MENPFLKKKYDLYKAPEVRAAAKRTERRTGTKVPEKPEVLIQNYLDRFNEIIERDDPKERSRGIEALKRILHRHHVIKLENVPESVFLLEQRIARELGHGDMEITDEFKERKTAQIIADQTSSLDKWVDYLASPDAQYPDWAKYWAIRSMLEMGKLEKKEDEEGNESARYGRRTKDTAAPFPTMNPRALALTIGSIRSRVAEQAKSKNKRQPVENVSKKLDDKAFQSLLSTENFSKIYAQFLIELPEYSKEGLEETRGKWVVYPRGSQAGALVKSLEGHPLEWCIADQGTAEDYLQGGDISIYYSLDENGDPTIPRAAIRMEGDALSEVRGIAPGQHTDPYIAEVIQKKMKEYPDGEQYVKKASDMKRMSVLEEKNKNNRPLTRGDLRFLYEFDVPIEGFGDDYGTRDPRIDEIKSKRDHRADLRTLFNCTEEELQKKEHFTLKNIPTWGSLPDPTKLKKEFKLDWVWEEEYRPGRPMTDLENPNDLETESTAKVFDISYVIRKKRQEDPSHPILTTAEVLEAIDEAGYRPATLEELLAYSRDYWKPEVDPKSLTEEERMLQNHQAHYIRGLNSVFSDAGGRRSAPFLFYWSGAERWLHAGFLGNDWDGHDRFLVLRKASS